MRMLMLVPLLSGGMVLSGCVAATTYGLKTDGRTPEAGEVEFTAGAAGAATGVVSLGDDKTTYWGGGGAVTLGLTDDVAISGSGGLGTVREEREDLDSPNFTAFRMADAELRWRIVSEDPGLFNLTALVGAGTSIDEPREYNRNWGAHAGLVASHLLGETAHIYYGGKLNPAIDAFYMIGSVGMTADTITEGPMRATFGTEVYATKANLWDNSADLEIAPAYGAGVYLNFARNQ